ncbi:acyl carrier protein [Streptomyces bambusae]|uniref:Carrier domain-containing protein n=1 Tax=Streptomyces bambusae TaxID=1550616 RepID=A0ABS6Z5Z1_9ACTN|nr:acyl carrier protein [Streptomyces bambusae]MBW5482628.1 hypothetical protein [Streptomyces bambusae]
MTSSNAGTTALTGVTTPPSSTTTPVGAAEEEIRALWSSVLKIAPPPPDASFFELGGDSLAAHRMLRQLSRTYGVTLRLRQIYETPTVAGLARVIAGAMERRIS